MLQVGIMSTLDLSFNRLTTLRSYGLVRLERLDVSYNAIDNIDDEAFADLHQTLTDVDLGHNRLTELNGRAVSRAHGLVTLDLKHNNLHRQMARQSTSSDDVIDNPFQVSFDNCWTNEVRA
jgi:Leucine-rich repeat (LRR) protein